MRCPALLLSLALSLASGAAAQDLRLRDGPWYNVPPVTDTGRGRVIVPGTTGDCQEWDGQRWLRRPGLPLRTLHAMVYDPTARRTLVLAASVNAAETWDYDGAAWRQLAPAAMPTAIFETALTFDAARGRPLLFGGSSLLRAHLDETWEWNGSTWVQRQPLTSPPGRVLATMAFDALRGMVVLFGGSTPTGILDDTWEWNGTTWQQRVLAVRPGIRWGHAMAWHAARRRIVLFGGESVGTAADLWEYDGIAWSQPAPTGTLPGPRRLAALVDEPGSNELLLIGGYTGVADHVRDALRWNGVRWQAHPGLPVMPPWRAAVACASLPQSGATLMFGGLVGPHETPTAETWRWDGASWALAAAGGPPVRFGGSLWSDFTDVFLFGGAQRNGPFVADTWRWNGSGWTQLATPVAPLPRLGPGIAFDHARGLTLLFGGHDGLTTFGDTWSFNGTSWSQLSPPVSPPARSQHGLADDLLRSRVVLFGGSGPGGITPNRDDTWEWDGSTWIPITPAVRPPTHGRHSMAFDLQLGKIVLAQVDANGRGLSVFTYDGSTWAPLVATSDLQPGNVLAVVGHLQPPRLEIFNGSAVIELSHAPALAVPYGADCGSGAPAIAARTEPRVAAAEFGLELVRAPANAPAVIAGGTAPSSVPVGPCTQLVSPVLASVFLLANAAGFAQFDLPVPANAALLGTTLFFQGAAIDPAAPVGFTTTAGLRLVVGD